MTVFQWPVSELLVLLDTNFIFAIIDLHSDNHLVNVSKDLVDAIRTYNFPFKVRYHELTLAETRSTIEHYSSRLRGHLWSKALSRAALSAPGISSIEYRYHELNAKQSLDVDAFLARYSRFDVILREKGVHIFRDQRPDDALRYQLLNEYKEYLGEKAKEKPYETINHDATVLAAVRSRRSGLRSTLEAGALLLSCDFSLQRFDWINSRRAGERPSVILPNVFWQIIKPFVPSGPGFDRAFAASFSLHEFRSLGADVRRVTSKLLGLLASVKGLSEETAVRLVSDELLQARLEQAGTDRQFREVVESSLSDSLVRLEEDKAALDIELAREREFRDKEREELQSKSRQVEKLEATNAENEKSLSAASEQLRALEDLRKEGNEREAIARGSLQDEKTKRERAEIRLAMVLRSIAVVVSLGVGCGIVAVIHYTDPQLEAMREHKIGLEVSLGLLGAFVLLGCLVREWRNFCWIVAALPLLIAVLQIL